VDFDNRLLGLLKNTTNLPMTMHTVLALTMKEPANVCIITYMKLDIDMKILFTLYSKSLIYYTKFENSLMSFLTFAVEACLSVR